MSEARPEEPSPAETWLPERALVVGLARSGLAAAGALAGRGVRVVAADRSPDVDAGRLGDLGVELRPRNGGGGVARRDGTRGQEPGRTGRVAARRRRSLAWHPRLERGRARLPPLARRLPPHRRHGHEREDDDHGAARRDPARSRPPGRGRRQCRPRPHRCCPGRRGGLVDRVRALELPARGRPHARLRRRRAPQPRARPSRPARQLRRVPRREAPHLRAGAREGRPARLRDRGNRVLRRRPVARRAADPRPPQPGERSRRDRRSPRRGRARGRDRAGATHVPRRPAPARVGARAARRPLGQRLEGDEHRRRPPWRRRLRRAAAPDPRGLAQGRGFRPLRAGAAGQRPLDLSRRRRERRARRRPRRRRPGVRPRRRTSPPRSRAPPPTRSPATSSCSRRPARATTSSRTSRNAATRSGASSRSCRDEAEASTSSSGICSCSSRRRSSSSGSSWCTARPRAPPRSATPTRSASSRSS